MCTDVSSESAARCALLTRLADRLPDIVIRRRLWPDDAVEYVNAAVERVTGYTPAELYADPDLYTRIVHPDELSRLESLIERADNDVLEYMARWVCKDGSIRHVQYRGGILRDEGGRAVAVEGVARDVTAHVHTTAAMRRHEEILDLASDSIFTFGPDARLTSWNKGAARLYGWDEEEVIGRHVHELLCTRFPKPMEEIMRAFFADGHWEGQLVHTTRNGGQVTVESRWTLQRDATGTVTGYLEINHDITERQRLESELIEREHKYRDLFDNSPDMYFLGIPAEHRIIDCNQTLLRKLGYAREEIVGQTSNILFEPASFVRLSDWLPQLQATQGADNVEVQVRRKDGALLDVLLSATLEPSPTGGAHMSRVTLHDVTERKRMEQARGFLSAIVKSSPDAIVGGDLDGAIVSWNAGAEKLYGYTAAEAIGQHFTILAAPESRDQMERILAQVMRGKTAISHEMRRLTKDGRVVEVAVTAAPVYDEHGKVIGAASVSRDITERKRIEHKLQESEERFRLIAEITPAAHVLVRASDDVVLYANTAAGQLAGVPAEQLIGAHGEHFYHLDELQKQAYFAEVRCSGVVRNIEVQQVKQDGSVFWGLASAAVGVQHGDEVILATVLDISDRKLAEIALAEREARLRAIIENTDDSIWSIDRDYRLLVGNSTFDHITKAQIGRVLATGESVFDVPYPSASKAFWLPLYERVLAGEAVPFQLESALRPGVVLEGLLNPIRDASGAVTGVVGRSVNITERLRSEAKLQETTRRLQLAAGAAGIGIWNWNFEDGSIEWDDRMCELFAVSDEQRAAGLFHEVWRSRIHPDDLALAQPARDDVSQLAHEWSANYRIVLPDGRVRYLQASSIVERDRHGKPYRMIGVIRDITEQKLYEQLLQDTNALLELRVRERTVELNDAIEQLKTADRLKDEFLAAMSHELRTPLAGILGAVDLLSIQLHGSVTERQQRQLGLIQTSGERLLKMVSELLRYANLTAGKAAPLREHCSLAEVGAACISKASHAASAKHLRVDYLIPSPGPIIISDAQCVVEVLDALLDNAVKFTPDGGRIALEVRVREESVQLAVSDTGIGIEPEKLKSIFMPFVQGDGGLARRYEGVGLGLAYAAKMVEALGGSIVVESEPGTGSRFTVTLPHEYPAG